MTIETHNWCFGVSLTYPQALNILKKKVEPKLLDLEQGDTEEARIEILDKMRTVMHWLGMDSEALPRTNNPDFKAIIESNVSWLNDLLH